MVRVLVWLGSLWGLICALALSGIRFANSIVPERDGISTFAFTLVYAAPFVIALAAVFWKSATQQAAVWLAAGVLAFLASFTAFSGVSLVFIPAAPLLILAAIFSTARSLDRWGLRSGLPILPVAMGLTLVGVAAFVVLITLTSDPGCWVLIRYADGREEWQVAPPDVASTTVIKGPNGQTASGSGVMPPKNADGSTSITPGIVTSRCDGDVIGPIESVSSIMLWIFGGASLMVLRRYWSASPVFGGVTKG